jgi:prolipoprotein diacylglyceryl transferase
MATPLGYITWSVPPDLQLGHFIVHLYGLLFAVGLFAGGLVVIALMKQYKTSQSYLIYAFLGIIIGARLFHCVFYDPYYYSSHWQEVLLPVVVDNDGGLRFSGFWGFASHGGVIGLMLALYIFCRRNNVGYLAICDVFAIATPITGAFIRLGNLMNSEILGKPADISTAFVFTNVDNVPRYPANLYEALWYFVLFAVLWLWYKKKGFASYKSGFYTGVAFLGVAVFRFFIEFIKEDQEKYINALPLNMGQLLSIPFVVAGVILVWYCSRREDTNQVR